MAGGDELLVSDAKDGRPEAQLDERGEPVGAGRGGGQAQTILAGHGPEHLAEGDRRRVVDLVDDHHAEAASRLCEPLAGHGGQRLHRSHDHRRVAVEVARLDPEEVAEGATPLLDEVVGVDDHQRRLSDARSGRRADHGLAAAARDDGAALHVADERRDRRLLVVAEPDLQVERSARQRHPPVLEDHRLADGGAGLADQGHRSPRNEHLAVRALLEERDLLRRGAHPPIEADPAQVLRVREGEATPKELVRLGLEPGQADDAVDDGAHPLPPALRRTGPPRRPGPVPPWPRAAPRARGPRSRRRP